MKEIDDTEIEIEGTLQDAMKVIAANARYLVDLERRVANLEARKPPQDTNPDPEWYS